MAEKNVLLMVSPKGCLGAKGFTPFPKKGNMLRNIFLGK